MPASKPKSVKLAANTAKRLAETGRYVEQQPRNQVEQPTPPQNYGGGCTFRVTTSISKSVSSTPGSGQGIPQKFNGTSYSDLGTTAYKIYNDSDKIVAVNAYVLCVPAYGFWHVVVAKCANLS